MTSRSLVNVTLNAWQKIHHITRNNNLGMLLSASSGGCSGFNYSLTSINSKDEIKELKNPVILSQDDSKLYIDPRVEMFLIGTTIDYVKEDYSQQIYESKFLFIPDKDIATSCGCGVSFSPKNFDIESS